MDNMEVDVPTPLVEKQTLPTVLTVAGSDSSGGAGIEADLKTLSAHGCYGLTCITALTAQNTQGVKGIEFTRREALESILEANYTDVEINVVKTGLLTMDAIDVLGAYLEKYGTRLVVDPVMVATTGAELSKKDVLRAGMDKLAPRAILLTPNIDEARAILSLFERTMPLENTDDVQKAAKMIAEQTGAANVLLKGGHLPQEGDDGNLSITNVLYSSHNDSYILYKTVHLNTKDTHGTGCTLASSISANLARGFPLQTAIECAISYVHGAITSSTKIGKGNGPLNHLYAVNPPLPVWQQRGSFVDYLINHPHVKPHWDAYVNHPFVKQLANDSLHHDKFIRYISQDYPYLVNYTKIHSIAASVAPDLKSLEREIEILNDIKRELDQHFKRLSQTGSNFNNMQMSIACKNYTEYLTKVAQGNDWLEINVALAPCLIGYHQASLNANPVPTLRSEYKEWLETYKSAWYSDAVTKGEITLNEYSKDIDQDQVEKLVHIFAHVCSLEVEFWDDALNHEKH